MDERDRELIKRWDRSSETTPYINAQMISARGAEKAVIQLCQVLGYEVEDISIHQVTGKSQDWRRADIQLGSGHLLDVKNARFCVNSKVYSEICVPAFKQKRGNDVTIVGVFSPYLNGV